MAWLMSQFQARAFLERKARVGVYVNSANLGKSKAEFTISEEGVRFEGIELPWESVELIAKEDRKVFRIESNSISSLQLFSDDTQSMRTLCATESAPTTLVSGIPMHRIKDLDPWRDAKTKVEALGRPKGNVLDTCFGLGYSAIFLAYTAAHVTTYEIDPTAVALAKQNPWSEEAFSNPKIDLRIADVSEAISDLPTGRFAAVLHDPPTLAIAGDLYSEAFYQELARIMKHGAPLFHYIGDPHSHLGKKIYPGVMRRLAAAGFRRTQVSEAAHGVLAQR